MASVKQAWIKKYGEKEGLKKWRELNKGKGTLEWYEKKYGIIEGKKKYEDKNKKLSVSVESLRLNGKSEEEIERICSTHKNKSKQTLSNMIDRHGEEEGIKKYEEYRYKNKLTSCRRLDFWLKKCNGNLEEAKEKLKEFQRRDINWFINHYGEIDGYQKYYNSTKKRGRTLENYIKKYGSEIGLTKYIESCKRWKNGQRGIFNSKGQIEVEEFLSSIYDNVKGNRVDTGLILNEDEKEKYDEIFNKMVKSKGFLIKIHNLKG